MINAHPEACIAVEADVLSNIRKGYDRRSVFTTLVTQAYFVSEILGNRSAGYDYTSGSGGQGRYETLHVIGDKMGPRALGHLHADPGLSGALEEFTGLPLKLIHVIRNPFDSVATMYNRAYEVHREERVSGVARLNLGVLRSRVNAYLTRTQWMMDLKARDELEILDVFHEDFLANPEGELRAILEFLGLEGSNRYLRGCAAVTLKEPRMTRFSIPWPEREKEQVFSGIENADFLSHYRFTDPTASD
jgi:hypothetical protein